MAQKTEETSQLENDFFGRAKSTSIFHGAALDIYRIHRTIAGCHECLLSGNFPQWKRYLDNLYLELYGHMLEKEIKALEGGKEGEDGIVPKVVKVLTDLDEVIVKKRFKELTANKNLSYQALIDYQRHLMKVLVRIGVHLPKKGGARTALDGGD